jgi:hypothetical protein
MARVRLEIEDTMIEKESRITTVTDEHNLFLALVATIKAFDSANETSQDSLATKLHNYFMEVK